MDMRFPRIPKNVPASHQPTVTGRPPRKHQDLLLSMSRRKVRGLTRMGRQVSEDPDLDTLLSTLSPEEMEELEKDMMKVPDVNPGDGEVAVQSQRARGNDRCQDAKSCREEGSIQVKQKNESQKRDNPRQTSQSQEGNEDAGLQRRGENEGKDDEGKVPESLKEEQSQLSSDLKDSCKEKKVCEDSRMRDKKQNRESKTRDVINKLQEEKKKEDIRREDCRRRDDTKTKDIISRLREKSEKEGTKERVRRSDSFRTQGLVSRMLEKQNKSQENPVPVEKNLQDDDKNKKIARRVERQASQREEGMRREEELLHHSDHLKEKEAEEEKVDNQEKLSNCVAPTAKTKEEEAADEDSSMFDELLEQVRGDDPSLVELNVNNSEVIKTKTLIELAEALRNNTHVRKVALANCRADDHVAYAVAGTLRHNATITSINLDSNHLTGKGILSLIQALRYNATLTELRFQNQRHICGGKTEMEMIKVLKENTTLLKLGYHFELAGPRMTTTNILSRNMDRQRQRRLQEQKQAQAANGTDKKDVLEVPKMGGGGSLRNSSTWSSPKASPKPSPMPSPMPSPKLSPKRGAGAPPPPPPPGGGPPPPPPPMLEVDSLRNSLTPVSRRSLDGKSRGGAKNSRDQLLASIRGSNIQQLKKVPVPKWLQ
ncbi:leiomodin-1 isoform X1 [Syngnathoides biaculeatus]|uniref:leiomodin-1 isoform X1 n=2 Tax=Syngnathoides biaculeatus TaxID=300417 RepID=UPI002ADD9545|nr:leiomodin-1 isoform X1 [Syngnathoides biaculeatus]